MKRKRVKEYIEYLKQLRLVVEREHLRADDGCAGAQDEHVANERAILSLSDDHVGHLNHRVVFRFWEDA